MTKWLRLLVAGVLLTAGVSLVANRPVFAANPLSSICASYPESSTCKSSTVTTDANGVAVNPLTGPNGTLFKISTIIATVTGIAAVFIIIISGVKYMTSGGDAQKVAAAKSTLIGAIIGLLIIMSAQTIILFVVGRL